MNCTWNGLISWLPLCMYIYTCKTPICNRNVFCIVYILYISRYSCRYIIAQCSKCFYLFYQGQRPAIYSGAGFHSQPYDLPPWHPWSLCWRQIFPFLSHHCFLNPTPASFGRTGGHFRAEGQWHMPHSCLPWKVTLEVKCWCVPLPPCAHVHPALTPAHVVNLCGKQPAPVTEQITSSWPFTSFSGPEGSVNPAENSNNFFSSLPPSNFLGTRWLLPSLLSWRVPGPWPTKPPQKREAKCTRPQSRDATSYEA